MPIRAFVSQNLDQLKATMSLLEKASSSGSLEELRVSGIMTRTGPIKQSEIALRYQQARYEAYLRVLVMDDSDQRTALLLQFPDPYREKVMKVHSRSSVGVFGYPLAAPTVPPTP